MITSRRGFLISTLLAPLLTKLALKGDDDWTEPELEDLKVPRKPDSQLESREDQMILDAILKACEL